MPETLPHNERATRILFDELRPGDRIEILHEVRVGLKVWTSRTSGAVVRIDRRRHGLHFRRNPDDKVWSDIILLKRDDGEQTTVTVDEFTDLRRL
jgi:hypothetical protein